MKKREFNYVRTLKDIEDDPRVREIDIESEDGVRSYWCYLKSGWQSDPSCHIIHEWKVSTICKYLNTHVRRWEDDPDLIN